jgi:ATP-dependent Clp protease protease subunit
MSNKNNNNTINQNNIQSIFDKDKQISNFIPTIVERSGSGEKHWDLYSHLLNNFIIFFYSEVDSTSISRLCAELIYLSGQDSTREITIYINSPGGHLYEAIGAISLMDFIPNSISTVVMGYAFSAGALIAASGTKGRRRSMKHSTIMIHQPSSGTKGTASDIQTAAAEVVRMKHLANELLIKSSSIERDLFLKRIEYDWFMSAEDALNNGLIDEILEHNQ